MKKKEKKSDKLLNSYYKAIEEGRKHEARILLDQYAQRAIEQKTRYEMQFAGYVTALLIGVATLIMFI